MTQRVEIDGSHGEGGGQILRTSLTLSMLTGKPLRIFNIRCRRSKGGLRAQHLQCVRASQEISGASVQGDELGSRELIFEPGPARPGEYRFDIGTAGSTSLVLQTIALPLALGPGPSQVEITGGTHVPMAPCFHYLDLQWRPLLEMMGVDLTLEMALAGYYPRGGGKIRVRINPTEALVPFSLAERGEMKSLSVLSGVSNLDMQIAQRQAQRARKRLAGLDIEPEVTLKSLDSPGRGTFLLLQAQFDSGRCCYFGLGEIRKKAERVAEDATRGFSRFLGTDATVDEYAADQLLLPAALAGGTTQYLTPKVTPHLTTNADVIRKFVGAEVVVDGNEGEPGRVTVTGAPV